MKIESRSDSAFVAPRLCSAPDALFRGLELPRFFAFSAAVLHANLFFHTLRASINLEGTAQRRGMDVTRTVRTVTGLFHQGCRGDKIVVRSAGTKLV